MCIRDRYGSARQGDGDRVRNVPWGGSPRSPRSDTRSRSLLDARHFSGGPFAARRGPPSRVHARTARERPPQRTRRERPRYTLGRLPMSYPAAIRAARRASRPTPIPAATMRHDWPELCVATAAASSAAVNRRRGGPCVLSAFGFGSRFALGAGGGFAPTWLEQRLAGSDLAAAEWPALLGRAPLDIRINTLRGADPVLPEPGLPPPAKLARRHPSGPPLEPWGAWRSRRT